MVSFFFFAPAQIAPQKCYCFNGVCNYYVKAKWFDCHFATSSLLLLLVLEEVVVVLVVMVVAVVCVCMRVCVCVCENID